MTAPAIFTRPASSFEAQELQQTAALIFYEALARIFHACSQRRAQRGIAARI